MLNLSSLYHTKDLHDRDMLWHFPTKKKEVTVRKYSGVIAFVNIYMQCSLVSQSDM